MDLTRLPNDKKLQLCRWYFKVGCLFLPFVWAVNAVWFFKEAFMKPPYNEQKEIKRYVLLSGAGAIFWGVVMAVWIAIFQLQRVSWGATGGGIIKLCSGSDGDMLDCHKGKIFRPGWVLCLGNCGSDRQCPCRRLFKYLHIVETSKTRVRILVAPSCVRIVNFFTLWFFYMATGVATTS